MSAEWLPKETERHTRKPTELERTPELEHTPELEESPRFLIYEDLQNNYTDHLRSIEKASLGILDSVVRSARIGFITSLVLNILSFVLGTGVIIFGLITLVRSPESAERIVGVIFSLLGVLLVITLLFWRGPLERILESVSNLARINVVTIGLAHRLNQISQVFVQESIKGKMTIHAVGKLNTMIHEAVKESVNEFGGMVPKKKAEEQVKEIIATMEEKN